MAYFCGVDIGASAAKLVIIDRDGRMAGKALRRSGVDYAEAAERCLAEALSAGWIGGAGLDVFEHEPQVHPRLLELDNVVLAPHIGSATIDTRRKMSMLAAENCVAAIEGRRPPHLVNVSAWKN